MLTFWTKMNRNWWDAFKPEDWRALRHIQQHCIISTYRGLIQHNIQHNSQKEKITVRPCTHVFRVLSWVLQTKGDIGIALYLPLPSLTNSSRLYSILVEFRPITLWGWDIIYLNFNQWWPILMTHIFASLGLNVLRLYKPPMHYGHVAWPNNLQLNCLFNNLFRITTKKTSKLRMRGPLWREPVSMLRQWIWCWFINSKLLYLY